MKSFFGFRISPNQTKTPDGFLVAHNVPISRSGWFDYVGREIGLDTDDIVQVYRPPEELFNPGTMASFEGKPFVDGHPPRGVTPENATRYVRGSVQNVRRGTGDDSDLLLADLNVYDKQTMDEIQSGKREVSAGFDFDRADNGDGTYRQIDIVGNHVALVPKGRAGDRVRIKDSAPESSDDENEQAAKKYGIDVKKDGHRSPPEGYPTDREQYADPVNYKYPLTGEHARAAVEYFNHPDEREKGGYTSEEWDIIGRRIVHKLGSDYELKDGRIVTPQENQKLKGADSRMKFTLPIRKQGSVTRALAAVGLKVFAQDAEPDDIVDAVDAMADERAEEQAKTNPEMKPEEKKIEGVADENTTEEIPAWAKQLIEQVNKLATAKDAAPMPEDAIDAEIAKLEKESPNGGNSEEESHTIPAAQVGDEDGTTPVTPAEDRPQSGMKAVDSAYKIAALRAIKPAIAAIPDPVQRQKAADEAIKAINGLQTADTYAKIDQANRAKAADAAAKAKEKEDLSQLGKRIAQSRNPHYSTQK